MIQKACIFDIVETLAEQNPEAIALFVPGCRPLTYGRLLGQIKYLIGALTEKSIGPGDRVAVILNGEPEMAVAIVAVSCFATSAPLNPAYGAAELNFFFSDLNIKALLVPSSMESPARSIAQKLGISIFEITPMRGEEAGTFEIPGVASFGGQGNHAKAVDVAVVLHTSGTTARPKIVPLMQANICTSASNIILALGLTQNDRCLNVMPLFHIHGLMATLSSLSAGASVCLVRFEPQSFFRCLDEFAPTWYTAVPTIHQAVLRYAEAYRDIIERTRLRFIRSSSASLPQRVMVELERVFHAPVIESYGMTEACLQIASNPLPPEARKAGSVGWAAGSMVAIMDETGRLLSSGEIGEIVIQGGNVFSGYENNPAANANAFINGWFRTGDQGFLDSEGYLFITGRLKDIINRGGEMISPAEVDQVLMNHPAIEQAVTFPVPHPTLGEDVAAAVVLRKGCSITVVEILDFAAEQLAHFKLPHRLLIVDEIPKGPTGKFQRSGLAAKLGLTSSIRQNKPTVHRDMFELQLKWLWEEILAVQPIDVQNNFFELGGDSLHAMQLLCHIQRIWDQDLPLKVLYSSPTIEQLAIVLREGRKAETSDLLIPLKPGGRNVPFFCVYGPERIARHMEPDQPFYALVAPGMEGRRVVANVEELATNYIKVIQTMRPDGPYFLGGYSFGGVIAFEMAQQLRKHGHEVALLLLLDPSIPKINGSKFLKRATLGCDLVDPPIRNMHNQVQLKAKEMLAYVLTGVVERPKAMKKRVSCYWYLNTGRLLPHHLRMYYSLQVGRQALRKYVAQSYSGRAIVLIAKENSNARDRELAWSRLLTDGLISCHLPGNHFNLGQEPQAKVWAEQISLYLNKFKVPVIQRRSYGSRDEVVAVSK